MPSKGTVMYYLSLLGIREPPVHPLNPQKAPDVQLSSLHMKGCGRSHHSNGPAALLGLHVRVSKATTSSLHGGDLWGKKSLGWATWRQNCPRPTRTGEDKPAMLSLGLCNTRIHPLLHFSSLTVSNFLSTNVCALCYVASAGFFAHVSTYTLTYTCAWGGGGGVGGQEGFN